MTYEAPLLNLKAVVEQTGVPAHTLRAWERRYGLPSPQRSAGGQRLYSQHDVDTIKWLSDRRDEGLAISHAVDMLRRLLAKGQGPLAPRPLPAERREPTQVGASELCERWTSACMRFDEESAEQTLNQAFAEFGVELAALHVLQRGLARIGSLWFTGEASVQQEHFASELATRRGVNMMSAAPMRAHSSRIVIACPPEEEHAFCLLLSGFLLRRRGWQVLYLGANVPLSRMTDTLAAYRPEMVLSAAQRLPTANALMGMARMLSGTGVPLGYGGWIFNQVPALRDLIPGHFLGEHLDAVPQAVERSRQIQPFASRKGSDERLGEAVAEFHAQKRIIESTASEGLPPDHLERAQTGAFIRDLGDHIEAALSLGDLSFADVGLIWWDAWLSHRSFEGDTLRRVLRRYSEAAQVHLDEHGAPITGWLAGKIASL